LSIFAVTSGKGGVGKSSVSAYTAAALAGLGKRTLLVELGAEPRVLDIIAGTEKEILFDISDVAANVCEPLDAIVQTKIDKNLFLLPGAPTALESFANPEDAEKLLGDLASCYDCIVADGIDFGVISPNAVDVIINVTMPNSISVRTCAAHVQMMRARGAEKMMRLVINAVPVNVMPMLGMQDFDDIIDQIGAQLLGVVPHSPILQYCSNNTKPLDKDSMTADVFDNIAARLLGQNRRLLVR